MLITLQNILNNDIESKITQNMKIKTQNIRHTIRK